MTGWQRFFLLIACCIVTMILWPQYDEAGVTFMLMAGLLWTCVIIMLSVLSGIFGIYKFEFLNRFVSILYLGALMACLLFYFPLRNGETPAKRMQQGQWPTMQDVRNGLERMTLDFDFVHRTLRHDPSHLNEKMEKAGKTVSDMGKELKEKKKQFDSFVDQWEGEK